MGTSRSRVIPRLRRRRSNSGRYKILFVCSSGGHLAQLLALEPWWIDHDRTWVTFDTADSLSSLRDERLVVGHYPTTRNIPNLLRNAVLAIGVLRSERPDVIVSNGAGIAVPYYWLSRLFGIPTAYIEVYDRLDSATMTARLVRPVTDLFMVQWDRQLVDNPGAVVAGPLY